MDKLKKILFSIWKVLFVEGLLFSPVVLMIATQSTFNRTLKYLLPFMAAILPYVILKWARFNMLPNRINIAVVLTALIISFCFLAFFSVLLLESCAGHPPY
jgi:multisubunit Na+/H+ antiporter MnhC subunit